MNPIGNFTLLIHRWRTGPCVSSFCHCSDLHAQTINPRAVR